MIELKQGDCLIKLKELEDNSVDSIVTDPPYELGFMGKSWDKTGIANNPLMWKEVLRVLKPGGHLLAFSGTRTYHRMAVAIEDAGFEIRDMIEWVYGSGFPKSLNISKAINKIDGVKFDMKPASGVGFMNESDDGYNTTKNQMIQVGESTDRAKQFEGWGTALKPAHEPICMARKPLSEKTVAENVLKYGTGGINIDESRVGTEEMTSGGSIPDIRSNNYENSSGKTRLETPIDIKTGRFPANLIHDNSEEVRECFPETKSSIGLKKKAGDNAGGKNAMGNFYNHEDKIGGHNDSGNASRFFKSIIYQAKASKSERNKGLDRMEYIIENEVWLKLGLSSLMENINQLPKDILEGISTENLEWNIDLSGNNTMEQYQKDTMFIIKIISKLITELRTSNFLLNSNIKEYIVGAIKTIEENGLNLVESVENTKKLKPITTNEKMELALGVVLAVLETLLELSKKRKTGNFHSTVKPIALMEYLIKMITPKAGTVLDPFMGSGSTGVACVQNGFSFIGIDMTPEYIEIAQARINYAENEIAKRLL